MDTPAPELAKRTAGSFAGTATSEPTLEVVTFDRIDNAVMTTISVRKRDSGTECKGVRRSENLPLRRKNANLCAKLFEVVDLSHWLVGLSGQKTQNAQMN